jgi:hypothetical protein
MTFRESLPDTCPPQAPRHPQHPYLWRLLRDGQPVDADFDSQYLRNPKRTFPDPCSARAVSLITSLDICRAASKSPRMRGFTHAVRVKCCPSLGVWDQDKPEHVNWWPLKAVDVLQQLGDLEVL